MDRIRQPRPREMHALALYLPILGSLSVPQLSYSVEQPENNKTFYTFLGGGKLSLPVDIAVAGSTAYVAYDWDKLGIYDCSDPMKLRQLGVYKARTIGGGAPTNVDRVVVKGHTAFLLTSWGGGSILQLVDISNSRSPKLISQYDKFNGTARDLVVVGSRVYVSTGFGIQILDASDQRALTTLRTYNDALSFGGLAVTDRYIFAATRSVPYPGVTLLVIDPEQLVCIAALNLEMEASATPGGVAIRGNRAFIAAGSRGVYEIDISNPNAPVRDRRLVIAGDAKWVIPWDDWLVVPGDIRISFFDPQKDTAYFLEGSGRINAAAISGDRVFFLDDRKGIVIVRLTVKPKQ